MLGLSLGLCGGGRRGQLPRPGLGERQRIGASLLRRYNAVSEAMAEQSQRALTAAFAIANDRGVADAFARANRPTPWPDSRRSIPR